MKLTALIAAASLSLTACATGTSSPPRYTASDHRLWDHTRPFAALTTADKPFAQSACDAREFGPAIGVAPIGFDENGARLRGRVVLCQHDRFAYVGVNP